MSSAAAGAGAGLSLRPARLRECREIAALAAALLPEAWSEPQLSSEVALPEGRVWGAWAGAALVAFLVARRELDELHVLLMGVAPEARRRGAGAALLGALIEGERGLACVHLEVRESNLGAQAFYRSQGLAPTGRRPGHYPGGEAAILMSRRLAPHG